MRVDVRWSQRAVVNSSLGCSVAVESDSAMVVESLMAGSDGDRD